MQVDDPLAEIAADLVRRGWWKEQDCLTFLAAAFESLTGNGIGIILLDG